MRLVGLAVILAVDLAVGLLDGHGQPSGKVHKVGLLSPPPGGYVAAFEDSLRQLGYIQGSNILFEMRSPGGRDAVAELLRLKVEVIVTGPNAFIDAAKAATTTVPIVMVYGNDPVGRGYISSLARPGGNITGVTWESSVEIFGKHVEFLNELSIGLSRVGVISDPSAPDVAYFREADIAARRYGITLQHVQVEAERDLAKAFNTMVAGRAGAVVIFGGPRLWSLRLPIARLANKHALPTVYMYREGPEAGGLMSYGANLTESWRLAATYVDKILKGARPTDLPVQQPTKFELVINMKTARALGLTIPQSLLVRADEIIQ